MNTNSSNACGGVNEWKGVGTIKSNARELGKGDIRM